jgi:drug/metabolite transporter (DMT)-like permease
MKASSLGLIPLITPVLALSLGYLLNSEEIGWTLMIGAGLILSGLFAHNWRTFLSRLR